VAHTSFLVDAARDGDRSALTTLFTRHEGRLLAWVRATMPHPLTLRISAEDIVQETLLQAVRKVGGFQPTGDSGSFYRWLVGIARFKLMEARRAQRAAKRANERPLTGPVASSQTSPSGRVLAGERAQRLSEALATLPERQALAVRLRWLEGLSVAETAAKLECSETAVKSLVCRGMADLAGRLSR